MTADWRGMGREARSAAYDNGRAVADSAAQLARWKALSAPLRADCPGERDVPYGPRPRNRFDLYRCGRPAAPLLVFIHGGYWQRNGKEDFACMASGPLAQGIDVATLGYTLAPEATLAEIAGEVDVALSVIAEGAGGPLVVSGWSAGGHLAALALGRAGVGGVLAVSGIFDLDPLRGTTIDDAVRISDAEAAALSPMRRGDAGRAVVAFGAAELPELRRQSRDYAAARTGLGFPTALLASPGRDHFSVLDGLIDPHGDLTRAVVRLAGDPDEGGVA